MSIIPTATGSETTSTGAEERRSWLGVASAAALLLIAVSVGVGSISLGYWTTIGPGAGFFPLCLAIALGVAAVLWGLGQWRGVPEESAEELESRAGMRGIITTVGSLVALAVVLEILGFQLAVLIFLFFHLRIIGKQKWPVTLGVTLFGSFGLFALFSNVLSVSLPTSSIPLLSDLGL